MNSKRNNRKNRDQPGPNRPQSATQPSQAVRGILTGWLGFHLLAILISFLTVVEPSSLQAGFMDLVRPYLQLTHFGADDRPIYLAHGNSDEQPHRIQVTSRPANQLQDEPGDWQDAGPIGFPGFAVSDRVHRWTTAVALLADNEQASLVAELVLPLVEQDSSVTAVRVVRLPTDLSDINAEMETPYMARVVRRPNHVTLIQMNPARLSAQVISGDSP